MPASRLLGAAAISFMITMPAMAQAVMPEPAYCAQFYPTANCQNKGPGNPYTDPNYRRGAGQNDAMWSGDQTIGVAGATEKRSRTHRSSSSTSRRQ
jgi:hypothetical protein